MNLVDIHLLLHKDSCHRGKSQLGIGLFIHELPLGTFDYITVGKIAFTQKPVEWLTSTFDELSLFLLNSKLCGVPLARFMTTSALVASFANEFTTVSFEELKNGPHLDRSVYMFSQLPLQLVLFPS